MSELFEFYDEQVPYYKNKEKKYKVIIADDEDDVHKSTQMVLKTFQLEGVGLSFFNAYDYDSTINLLNEHPDTAVIFLDVVMEENNSGLRIIDYIRNKMNNLFIRIILRTGQPGDAPEEEIVSTYDINDYLLKTDVTVQRLYTSMYQALRAFRDINKIEMSRQGLEKIVYNSSSLFVKRSLQEFFSGILRILADLRMDSSSFCFADQNFDGSFASVSKLGDNEIVAATGEYSVYIGQHISDIPMYEGLKKYLEDPQLNHLADIIELEFGGFLIWRELNNNQKAYIYLESKLSDFDKELLKLFMVNYTLALDGYLLNEHIGDVQREIITRLSNVIETRSNETANHVHRMSRICEILAEKMDLESFHKESIGAAACVHDVGKIGIDESILMKPGRLTKDEFEVVKEHSRIGYEIFKDSNLQILQDAAIICLYHHERYDGKGYPEGLKGDEIPIIARIVAVADVFDALLSKRIYKEAWTLEETKKYFIENKGLQFDPNIVDRLIEAIENKKILETIYKIE